MLMAAILKDTSTNQARKALQKSNFNNGGIEGNDKSFAWQSISSSCSSKTLFGCNNIDCPYLQARGVGSLCMRLRLCRELRW